MAKDRYTCFLNHVKEQRFEEAYTLLIENPALLKKIDSNANSRKIWASFCSQLGWQANYGIEEDDKNLPKQIRELAKRAGMRKDLVDEIQDAQCFYAVQAMG